MDMSMLSYIILSMTVHLVLINGILFNLGGVHQIPSTERTILFIGMFLMLVVLRLLIKYSNHEMMAIGVRIYSRVMRPLHSLPIISLVVGFILAGEYPLLLGLGISSCLCSLQYIHILMIVK